MTDRPEKPSDLACEHAKQLALRSRAHWTRLGDLARYALWLESELTARTAETEEQAAERELGAWLVAHPGWTGLVMRGRIDGAGPWTHYRVELKPPEQEALFSGWLTSPASAIRAALAKARGGEGRWHG